MSSARCVETFHFCLSPTDLALHLILSQLFLKGSSRQPLEALLKNFRRPSDIEDL